MPRRPARSVRVHPSVVAAVVPVVALVVVALAACSTTAPGPAPSPRASPRPFPTSGVFDYQLGGAYPAAPDVTIVERDSTAHPSPGRYTICYVNGFQTQGPDTAMWERDHPSVLLRDASGAPVHDPGWPDEVLLDTSTAGHRAEIADVLSASVDRCGRRGFDAVEFDNLDSWTRSHHALTQADALATASLLVGVAHRDGLAAGQKNAVGLGSAGRRRAGFDFAVTEECFRYRECAASTRVYGDRVVDVEYTDAMRTSWAAVCASSARPAMTIQRDRDLVPRSAAGYRFAHC